jgi:hypothetical protein
MRIVKISQRVILGALSLAFACGGDDWPQYASGPDTSTTAEPTTQDPTEPDEPTSTGADESMGTSPGSSTGEPVTTGTTGEPVCGNGMIDPDEGCDDGAANSDYAACNAVCQPNVCGDGDLHIGVEACDEGSANVDTGFCRSDCALNVCGDGFLFVGAEECDSGEANGPTYGGCDDACTINRCGDGELDAGDEECDDGERNGSSGGDGGMAGCGLDCGFSGRRLFLSSQFFNGDMGSRAGADLACQNMAAAAGLLHATSYRALLGDSLASANTMFADDTSGLPFIDPSGMILAASYPELIELGPGMGVTTTETGEIVHYARVWTNLGPFGDAYLLDPEHTCGDWTSATLTKSARAGHNAVMDDDVPEWQAGRHWLSYETRTCAKQARIYCVEAP